MRPGWALVCCLLFSTCIRKDVNRHGEIRLRGERPIHLDNKSPGAFLQKGIASWYGHPYHGRRTANGETYDMWRLTAAHKTLPFGTQVRVVHQGTGAAVVVRINDRGPFIKGRIIDLSRAAAKRLNLIETGTAPVRLFLVEPSGSQNLAQNETHTSLKEKGYWTIQIGSFSDYQRARIFSRQFEKYSAEIFIQPNQGLFRVRLGQFQSKHHCRALAKSLSEDGMETWILFVQSDF